MGGGVMSPGAGGIGGGSCAAEAVGSDQDGDCPGEVGSGVDGDESFIVIQSSLSARELHASSVRWLGDSMSSLGVAEISVSNADTSPRASARSGVAAILTSKAPSARR